MNYIGKDCQDIIMDYKNDIDNVMIRTEIIRMIESGHCSRMLVQRRINEFLPASLTYSSDIKGYKSIIKYYNTTNCYKRNNEHYIKLSGYKEHLLNSVRYILNKYNINYQVTSYYNFYRGFSYNYSDLRPTEH